MRLGKAWSSVDRGDDDLDRLAVLPFQTDPSANERHPRLLSLVRDHGLSVDDATDHERVQRQIHTTARSAGIRRAPCVPMAAMNSITVLGGGLMGLAIAHQLE